MHDIYMLLVKYLQCFRHLQGVQTIFSMLFQIVMFKDKKFGREPEKLCENSEKQVGPCRACGVCFFPSLPPPADSPSMQSRMLLLILT